MINEDIGALLAEVNAELISQKNDHDDYELNFESDDNNNDDNDNDDNDNDKVIDTSKILKDAAQTIQQEEKVLLDKVITNVSNEIKIIPHPPFSKKSDLLEDNNDYKSMNAMNILIEASRDVDQNIKTNNKDNDQLSIKMIDDDIDSKMMNITNNDNDSDDDDNDQEEEEEDNDYDTGNDATRLNQTLLFACYNDKIEN